mgnify:FL=1
MKIEPHDFAGMRITVMGLGLHGGGAAAAEYCSGHGAEVTITDLKGEKELQSSIDRLAGLDTVRFVLGRHEEGDFRSADLVVKNPAVPRTAHYLRLAPRIETDISLYLSATNARIIGITGTKGKSTTATAVAHLLRSRRARLGGNITVSPLTFLDDEYAADRSHAVGIEEIAVLELSSFQLGDLPLTDSFRSGSLATIEIAVLTSFMRDHQDYYHSMEAYRRDKELLFELQDEHGWKVIDPDADFAHHFLERGPGRLFPVGRARAGRASRGGGARAYLDGARGILVDEAGERHDVFPDELPVPGEHNRRNLLFAAATAYLAGAQPDAVASELATFDGVRHRMELVRTVGTCRFVNDSAATVPEAALAAVRSFDAPVYLIAGGTDKNLEFPLFRDIAEAARCYLLSGSATDRIIDVLSDRKSTRLNSSHYS